MGSGALFNNTLGSKNTAIGWGALFMNNGGDNIAIGYRAGENLGVGSFNIDIGNDDGTLSDANTIRIGSVQARMFIAGIRGKTTGAANAVPVVIDSNGQLGTASSSRRYKNEIKPMDKASEAILALQPVTFHYKSDDKGRPQFGLIAEVAAVNPDLVVRDENGEIYTVRYDAVNAMLLNQFLKEHRKVEEQQKTIGELKSTVAHQQKTFESKIAQQEKQIEALATGLQKVSAQLATASPSGGGLETSKFARRTAGRIRRGGPAPQVVNNP